MGPHFEPPNDPPTMQWFRNWAVEGRTPYLRESKGRRTSGFKWIAERGSGKFEMKTRLVAKVRDTRLSKRNLKARHLLRLKSFKMLVLAKSCSEPSRPPLILTGLSHTLVEAIMSICDKKWSRSGYSEENLTHQPSTGTWFVSGRNAQTQSHHLAP